ncbi:helix-turn-helix transcriptional regulator [Patulibacter minatonensis]|uniref:helix-turn-helix transcriptional regulator n=1 Tax=Patulibacter minatonensis TaxID=298163 RepID=UPI00047C3766|nr:AAA family ATPase [Patulibacter minatonensis]
MEDGGRRSEELLERDRETAALRTGLDHALRGTGGVVLVEGVAGVGKTALLRALRADVAADASVLGLSALGGELEREFPFGLVRQLLEPVVLGADPDRRAALLSGAAALAGPIVGAAPDPENAGADAAFATLHGLYWLVAALADERPLVLVVDDAHWADAPSLRFLDFLSRRIDELPVLLALATRPNEPGAEHDLLTGLAEGPHVTVVRPRALSPEGTRVLVDAGLGTPAPDDVVTGAAEATGGNPLLLRELVRTLAESGRAPSADAVREAVPSSVTRSVERRLRQLDDHARLVAHALAVLGDTRGTDLVAAVAGLDPADADRALDVLRAVGLAAPDGPRFAHPLLRAAVAESVGADERIQMHRTAAALLHGRPGAEEELVLHLLAAPPARERWVVPVLRRSARHALADGAPDAAVRRLRRALEELPADAEDRDALLLQLARATVSAGDVDARLHLAAAAASSRPEIAGPALALQVVVHAHGAGMAETVDRLQATIERLDAPEHAELRSGLRAQLYGAMTVDTRLADRRAPLIATMAREPDEQTLPVLAFEAAAGDATAAEALELAERALADRPLARVAGVETSTPFWAVMATVTLDGADLADRAIRDAELSVRGGATRVGGATVAFARSEWAMVFGSAVDAEASAREAVDLWLAAGLDDAALPSRIALARTLVRLGRLDEADAELDAVPDLRNRFTRLTSAAARGELRLTQHRPQEAVAELELVRELSTRLGWRRYPLAPVDAQLARALAACGRTEEARVLATDAVADARRRGAALLEAEGLVALGLASGGDEGLELLREALDAADRSAAPYVGALAGVELGAALRRAGRRVDAREVLSVARDDAHRTGNLGLLERATEELVLAGGRPRRTALTGVDALTPSERRMADHAAAGLTNRQIAETLFVTRKTVESTLGQVFQKLDIRSRTQLAGVLGGGPTPE